MANFPPAEQFRCAERSSQAMPCRASTTHCSPRIRNVVLVISLRSNVNSACLLGPCRGSRPPREWPLSTVVHQYI